MNRIVICPTWELQQMVVRRIAKKKTRYNYVVAFLDVSGWGLSLGVVDWLPEGSVYVNR